MIGNQLFCGLLILAFISASFGQGGDDPFGPQDDTGAPHILAETEWIGKNGKSIRGIFVEEKDGLIHVMELRTKKVYKIDRANLSAETLEWFNLAKARDLEGRVFPSGDAGIPDFSLGEGGGFVPLDQDLLERNRISPSDPADYGLKSGGTTHESLAPFFVWWDQNSNLPIPKGRDFEAKCQWLHREFARRIDKHNNHFPSTRDLKESLGEYFDQYYGEEATFSIRGSVGASIDGLVTATGGGDATILRLHAFSRGRSLWGIDCSLVEVKPDASISLIAFNERLGGKLEAIDAAEAKKFRLSPETLEIKLAEGSALPDRVARLEPRLFVTRLMILSPSVKPAPAAEGDDGADGD